VFRSEFLVSENDPTSSLPWQSIVLGFAPPNAEVEPSFTCGHLLGWLDPSAQWMRRWLLAAHARDFFFAAASRTAWSQLLSLACLSVPRHVTEWTHGDVASNVAQASLLHCEFLWSQTMILIGYHVRCICLIFRIPLLWFSFFPVRSTVAVCFSRSQPDPDRMLCL
jgi:hypothetical protein